MIQGKLQHRYSDNTWWYAPFLMAKCTYYSGDARALPMIKDRTIQIGNLTLPKNKKYESVRVYE